MRRLFKWFVRALIVVVIAVVAVAGVGLAAFYRTLPAASGKTTLAGLNAQVRVVRDSHGIPHIEAKSRADAFRALGYVHAQDRLWQMHVLRMVAQGRLSEMFGSATIDSDIFLKTVDLASASKASYEALSDEAKAMLTAYAEGVNDYLERKRRMFEPAYPPEFMILGVAPEPWEPWQSVALLKVMALTLDSNMSDEVKRLALAARGFGPQEIDDLMPYGPRDNPPPLPDLRNIFKFPKQDTQASMSGWDGRIRAPGLAWETGITASNNWVVAGSRTVSGKPLLANDPHLGLTAPGVFYLAHMAFKENGEQRHIIGATLAGTPLALVARNGKVAWGLTTTVLDSQDVFIERLNPDNANQYLTPTGWREFDTSDVEVTVKGGEPVKFTRRLTRHGPVLPDKYRGVAKLLPEGHVAAVEWVTLANDDTTVEGALGISTASSVDDFLKAVRKVVAPMQSMVVADTAGNIALVAPGRIPLRNPANMIAGREPVPGWDPLYDWIGFLTPDDVPKIVNPPDGALATANANWMPPDYSHHITYDWDEHFRQARVEELVIGRNEKHSPQTMHEIQADTLSTALVDFRDEAMVQLERHAGQDSALLEAIANWDGHMVADRPEPLIMTAWWRHFQIALFGDELGDDYERFAKGNLQPVINVLRGRTSRDWCDKVDTPAVETCGQVLSGALTQAIEEISGDQGNDWHKWNWGKAHPAFNEHRPFSSVELLSRFFTILQNSAGGSYTLLRGRTDFREKHPYYNVHASAYRGIYDFSDLDKSKYVITTGESGNFLSSHYRDLAPIWAKVEYLPMSTRQEDYEKDADGVWIFDPEK
ncbi:MAG: penicillin acylase family protein [Salaquimonas sp.]|nr:penicillin acylase family protein [Salaquimonas sp.]